VILIGTGSEVHLALDTQKVLADKGVAARVVSMPSWERFERQPQAYRDSVLLPDVTARVSIEAGVTAGWQKWVGSNGLVIGIDRFGASAPYEEIYQQLGLTPDAIAEKTLALLGK
jgi:transketolase